MHIEGSLLHVVSFDVFGGAIRICAAYLSLFVIERDDASKNMHSEHGKAFKQVLFCGDRVLLVVMMDDYYDYDYDDSYSSYHKQ